MNFNFRNYINEIAHFLNENTEDELPPTLEEENPQNEEVDNPQDGAAPSAPSPTPTENGAASSTTGEAPQDDAAVQGEDDGTDPEAVNQDEIAGASEKSASFFKAFSDLQGMYNNLKEILKSTSFGEDLDKVREAALQQEKSGGDAKPPANPPQQ